MAGIKPGQVGQTINCNYMKYLACHCSCNNSLYAYASKLSPKDIDNAKSAKISKIRSMISSVRLEIHRMRGFVRLAPIGENVLYGYLKPRHNIGDQVAGILAHRCPNTILVLGNSSRSWISLYTKNGLSNIEDGPLDRVIEELGYEARTHDEKESIESLWQSYYDSQYRPERRNHKYFRANVTLTSMRSAKLKTEGKFTKTSLDDYMK